MFLTDKSYTLAEKLADNLTLARGKKLSICIKASVLESKVNANKSDSHTVSRIDRRYYPASPRIHDIANNDKLNSLVLESSITIQWNDPRLIFNENHDWNKYPYIKEGKSLLNALWFPNLYFIGSQKSEDIEGVVSKLGEVRLYKNGTISYEDRIRLTIGSCESTFQNFPFDTKICKVRGIVYEEDADTLRISESQILFDPELFSTIPGFDIDIQYLDEENSVLFWKNRLFSVKGFDVKFYRRTLSYIFYYIAPNQLIVSFTWLSFLIPLENIPGRLGILLVSMLLIRDYPYSFTSDYTALGIWSLLCRLQIMICIIGYMIIIKLNSKLEVEDASPQYTTNTTQRNGGLIRFFYN
ncbi:GLRA4 [Lepeophtheirus salmonis]|uniref:GLRA4 n=1 Tax=Lepeophtheirus salmonis TaxID=72036 RepID=A0A7R8H2G4_LEPSM|nr:GLRA4 [Lepeophtheirus salmonis]CAF2824042.1 GLRA4 [Lepeophtheirus salmonis]